MIPSNNKMDYKIMDRRNVDVVARGRQGPLAEILQQLLTMKKTGSIIINTTPENQRIVSRRMRTNIFKWKRRKGLKHVSVHLTKDGNVALYYEDTK